jgi:hypothetical protein
MELDEKPFLLFDDQDLELVEMVNEFAGASKKRQRLRRLFNTYLHPRGINELGASRQRRIAYAVIQLLDSLEGDRAEDRLVALRALRQELIEGGGESMPRNTGRALLETMKHLVREGHGQSWHQVEIAHEFFATTAGRPSTVRRQLAAHHLLEMSESWNQVAFDHHVHDAHTKGRKAPTHLIVDAWIKGIRQMTVIYYYCPSTEAISELIEAGQAMGVAVRPGIEVTARLRGKYVQLIWVLRGLHSAREYAEFMDRPATRAFLDEGRKAVEYNTGAVLSLLRAVNDNHLPRLRAEHGLDLPPLDADRFLHFVGVGQPSRAHLVEFLHQSLVTEVQAKLPEWRAEWQKAAGADRRALEERVQRLDALTTQHLASTVLSAAANPDVVDVRTPRDDPGVPDCLRQSPTELVRRLRELRVGSAVTLNPSNLTAAEVLEILYDCNGGVTDLEIFNLKDFHQKRNPQTREIGQIVQILNDGNPITCKRMIQEFIRDIERSDEEPVARADRVSKMRHILGDMQSLLTSYSKVQLGSRVGSDSVGRAHGLSGMGLAVMATLPSRAQREFRRHPGTREVIPVATETALVTTWTPRHSHIRVLDSMLRLLRRIPGLREFGFDRKEQHQVLPNATVLSSAGNVITLGGMPEAKGNGFSLSRQEEVSSGPTLRWRNLNTGMRDVLKVLLGLIPAFLTFRLTKDWWLLAYFGAFIWFGVTGLRNVLQSIVGGGGIVRSELLKWRDLVRWGRVADSLLYTGFSVPLLDWLVKSLILQRGLGVTTATAPLLLYAVMGLANGTYLFSHNMFRGLPRAAAFGNFFRSVLSIPVAFAFNAVLFQLLRGAGHDAVSANVTLQAWAAVIGKVASDTVAAVIEGAADRNINVSVRFRDYREKIGKLLEVHGRLEAMFPAIDVVESLASPKEFFRTLGKEALDLETHQIINALDLMYFWMYQPRARLAFEAQLASLSPEERRIILLTQRLLERKRPVSEMFLHNLVGRNFSPPLAFYLDNLAAYLRDMRALAAKYHVQWDRPKTSDDARASA